MKKAYLLLTAITFFSLNAFSQVTGIKTIGVDYATLELAITALNTSGVGAGGAIINVPAGYTETAPSGGYLLGTTVLNASLSSANALTIRKNGSGADPLITASTGTSTALDGIFIMAGVDYVTIDGISLQESVANTTTTTAMEFGYGFFNLNFAAPFDGCNNNAIQNCTITMNRTIATSSKAILVSHTVPISTIALSPSAPADLHNNNKFYANTISNVVTAIYLAGATSANDQGNDIGGASVATGNTITNVIGTLYSNVGAITATYQNNCNIAYNSIDNLANGGTNLIATAWGIYAYGPGCTFTLSKNIVTITEAALSTTYVCYGLFGNAVGGSITATDNVVTTNEVAGSAVNMFGIYFSNVYNTTLTGNSIIQNQARNAFTYGIYATGTGTVNISANTVKQVASVAINFQVYAIVSTGNAISETINNNVFDNISVAVAGTTGFVAAIYATNATPNKTISGNSINGTLTVNSTGPTYLILNNSTPTIGAGTATIGNNNFANVTKTGSGPLYGIYYAPTVAGSQNTVIYNNTFNNLTSGTGSLTAIYLGAGVNDSIYNNNIYNLTSSASISGIYSVAPACTNLKVFNNKIYSNASSGTGTVTNTGIIIGEATNATVFNNFIADLTAPAASNIVDIITGIRLANATANTSVGVYYNSIYLNATSTGTNFSTTGISHTASATATTNNLTMINNNIVNTSTANGTGVTSAYHRSSTALDNYNVNSNNNNFYAGTPSATRLIFYDGTNADQTLTAYKARVTPGDNNSITTLPVFTSTTDLHLVTSANCSLESAGKPIAGFTNDIDNDTRDVVRPDIGADEFVSATAATSVTLAGITKTGLIPTCTENGWTYYVDPAFANQYLFAIEWDPTNLGLNSSAKALATVDITVDPSYFTINDNSIPWGTWTMKRYWNVDLHGTTMTGTANVRFFYDIAEKNAIDAAATLFLATYPSGSAEPPTWFKTKVSSFSGDAAHMDADGVFNAIGLVNVNAGSAVTINGVLYAQFNSVSSFSGGTYATGVGPSTPLPITLNYLRGVKQGNNNNLLWKVTCNSTPKATLTLERSSDATNFTGIYTITADVLRCQQPFDHLDANPLTGKNYYRLKMVDNNGKITYSNTIMLLNQTKGFEVISIAPNPVTNGQFKLNVTSAENTKLNVIIIDMQGRVVQKQTINMIAGYNSLDMNVANLASGTYNIYGTTDADKSKVVRFVKR